MKKSKIFLALMLALVLCFSAFVPAALAAGPGGRPGNGGGIGQVRSYDPNAAITKILETPIGVTLPDPMNFEFEITPVKWDNAAFDGANMPTFDGVTITFSADMITPSANAASAGVTNPYTAGDTT